MTEHLTSNLIIIGFVSAAALVLFHPKVSGNANWRATVTPLASIIGSGFLVLAPLLVRQVGQLAHTPVFQLAACRCSLRLVFYRAIGAGQNDFDDGSAK